MEGTGQQKPSTSPGPSASTDAWGLPSTNTGPMTSGRTIDYEALAQEAMRGVVRQVLTRTAKTGLPGDHHFYISFDTQQPGVGLSKRLKEKYPEEMTIVLQHRFWDLLVNDERFEVKLTFDGIPERLVVPFQAIKVFFDPSVRYGLQFEEPDWPQDGTGATGPAGPRSFGNAQNSDDERGGASGPRNMGQRKRPPRKPRLERVDTPEPSLPLDAGEDGLAGKPEVDKDIGDQPVHTPRSGELKPVPAAVPPAGGAQIVSLSDFRKK